MKREDCRQLHTYVVKVCIHSHRFLTTPLLYKPWTKFSYSVSLLHSTHCTLRGIKVKFGQISRNLETDPYYYIGRCKEVGIKKVPVKNSVNIKVGFKIFI